MIMRAFFEKMRLADGIQKALLGWQGEYDKREGLLGSREQAVKCSSSSIPNQLEDA